MQKISTVLLMLALIGFAGPQLSMAEEERSSSQAKEVIEIKNAEGCQFLKDVYLDVTRESEDRTEQMKSQTRKAGGNAYQIIPQTKSSGGEDRTTHLKIYKCR